jgi:hypothetical protein
MVAEVFEVFEDVADIYSLHLSAVIDFQGGLRQGSVWKRR